MKCNWLSKSVPAAAFLLASIGGASASPDTRSVWLPEGFAYPNGIAFNDKGGLFVGSVVSGDIAVIELGERPEIRFREVEGRFAGTAIRYDPERETLWVSTPDFLGVERDGEIIRRPHRLAVVDANSGDVQWTVEMPDAGFANDIALDGEGGAYITDTTLGYLYHVPEPGGPFNIVADGLESLTGAIGPAGLAVHESGDVFVGIYSDGRLLRVRPGDDGREARVQELDLDGTIGNPDGMAFAEDGRLLLIDGGVASGDGKVVAIDIDQPGPHRVETLLSGLNLPVNLSVRGNLVAVTESRIRHRMVDEPTLMAPEQFRVILFNLAE